MLFELVSLWTFMYNQNENAIYYSFFNVYVKIICSCEFPFLSLTK